MRIIDNSINVWPNKDSINPELLFSIGIFIDRALESPLDIRGILLSSDNKKMADIYELYDGSKSVELAARSRNDGETKLEVKMISSLNSKVLDYIEDLRAKEAKGDLILKVKIIVRTIRSRMNISYMDLVDTPAGLLPADTKAKVVIYEYKDNFSSRYNNMWIFSGDSSPVFAEIKDNSFDLAVRIPSSDWVHEFCPALQIGRFAVCEYRLPEFKEGSGSIEERLNKAIEALQKMQEKMIKGEWEEVVEESRAISELIRNETEIRDILLRSGYTEEAYTDWNSSIQSLFRFSSKFIHTLDSKNKKINPDIKASKEDAYLIYAISVNIVNQISKKYERLS